MKDKLLTLGVMIHNFACLSFIQIDVPDFKGGRPLIKRAAKQSESVWSVAI